MLSCHFQAISQERTLPPVTVTATTNVTKAVSASCEQAFPDALETQWYKMNKKYLASFMANDQRNSALFRANGQIVYYISYGFEKDIPKDTRMIVRTHYPDYAITKAINVKQQDRDIWVINVEDKKKLILVRIEESELEEVGNFDKTM